MFNSPPVWVRVAFFALVMAVTGALPVGSSADPGDSVPRLSADTLSELLSAEIGLRRGKLAGAFELYARQAEVTGDAAVTGRAAVIASALQRDEALPLARRWLALDAGSGEAQRLLVMELARAGQWSEAVDIIGQLAAAGPGNGTAARLARSLREAQLAPAQLAPLVSRLRSLHAVYRDDDVRLALLWLLGDVDPADALRLRKPGDHLDPRSPDLALHIADLLVRSGDVDEAEHVLQDALRRHPDNPGLLFALARVYLTSDRSTAARELFERLQQRYPGNPDVLISLAYLALAREDRIDARRYLTSVADGGAYPNLTHLYLGQIALAEGRLDDAGHHFEQVASGPEYLAARQGMASLMAQRGELDAALAQLAGLRDEYPGDAPSLYIAASELLADAGRHADVVTLLDEALQAHPLDVGLLYARAMAHGRGGDIGALERDLHALLRIEPGNAYAMNALGYTLADRTDRYEEALLWVSRALALAPGDAAILDSMGWVQYRLRNYELAVQHLRRAHALLPDHEISAHLGEVLWMSGDRDAALQVWRDGLKVYPDSDLLRGVMLRFVGERALQEVGARNGADAASD